MKKLIIILFLFSFTELLNAQIPGYLGKRAAFEVQTMMPFASVFDRNYPLYIQAHLEYALLRKHSMSLEYRRIKFNSVNLTHTGVVAMYGLYRKGWSLAPYGKYFNMGLGFNSLKTTGSYDESFISAHIALGQRFVVAKRFTLNYGCETGVPLFGAPFEDAIVVTLFNAYIGAGILF